MKTLDHICFFLIFLLSLNGCKSHDEVVKFKRYKSRDYITKNVEIYAIKESLYPVLDSIIEKAEACSMYQGLENKLAFGFGVSAEIMENGSMDSLEFVVSISYPPKYRNHSEWTDAVFYYKGYDFYFHGFFFDSFLVKTNTFISLRCIDPKKYQFEMHFRGDLDMHWGYEYKDNQIINTYWGICRDKE